MRAILLTGGVGDIIAIESLMTDEERQSIDCIFYATRASAPCMELIKDLPSFTNLKKQAVLWRNFSNIFGFNNKKQLVDKLCAYQAEDLQATVKQLTEKVEDWSISQIFAQKRPYTYSSFIKYKMASIEKFNLPESYYCICPYSNNDKRDIRRDYRTTDWTETITILRNKNITGVVINNGKDYIPENPLLIDLNNKTTIREAVEIVKGGRGYIGIDSAFSVIATKIFDPNDIMIKSLNDHCYRWSHVYFAPQTKLGFIKRTIKV